MTLYYLAGPMRGISAFNFPAFRRATAALRAHGLQIISPHEMDEAHGYDWAGFTGTEDLAEFNFDIVDRLTEDILAIGQATGVIVLDGWEISSGARAEAAFAWATGKEVLRYEEANRMNGFRHSLQSIDKGMHIAVDTPNTSLEEWED